MRHLLLLSILGIFGCEGPMGPAGPPGVANITVIQFTVSNSEFQIEGDWAWYRKPVPQITNAVVDSGTVLTYYGAEGNVWAPLPITWTSDPDGDGQYSTITLTYVYWKGHIQIEYWTSYRIGSFADGTTGPFKLVIVPPAALSKLGDVDMTDVNEVIAALELQR